jgi:hypothetical protein
MGVIKIMKVFRVVSVLLASLIVLIVSTDTFAVGAAKEWRANTKMSDEQRRRIANGESGGGGEIPLISVMIRQIQCEICESGWNRPTQLTVGEYRPNDEPHAVVIYLKGGDGMFGWATGRPRASLSSALNLAILNLHDEYALLFVDFEKRMDNLSKGGYSPKGRGTTNHHQRLISTIHFANEQYPGVPVILVGHSNGAVSVNQFLHYLNKTQQLSLVRGAIFSATHHGEVESMNSWGIPSLVMGHELDGCYSRDLSSWGQMVGRGYTTNAVYLKLRNHSDNVDMVLITGGSDQGAGPRGCKLGHHSYMGSEALVTETIRGWIDSQIQ